MNHFLRKINNKDERGVITLEILLAMVIMIMAVSSVIMLVFSSQSSSVGSQTNQEALYKAQQQIEDARAQARVDFDSVVTKTFPPDGIYNTKNLTVTPSVDGLSKQINSLVSWGFGLKIILSTIVSDWNSALGGDTCNPILTGDWRNPRLLGYGDFASSDGATDVYTVGKKAYVTSDPSAGGHEDFYIFDVSDPTQRPMPDFGSPSKVNTGPGLAAVHVAGKYAYVANMSTTNQLQVIDVSVPRTPFVAGTPLDVTAPADTAVGNSIFYANKRIYLGLTKSTGKEFYVIDVSNPTSLSASSVKASFEINSVVNAITVKNGIAYLAVPDDPSTPLISEQLKVLDVSRADLGIITPLNPYGPNPSTMSGESVYISKDGKTLYLGEGGANPGSRPEFISLDVPTPGNISLKDSKFINASVNAIGVRTNLAFLWTSDTNSEFQIWNTDNLSAIYASLNMSQTAKNGLECDGNLLYTAQRSGHAMQIVGPGGVAPTFTVAIHNASHNSITTASVGDTVHTSASVSGSAGTATGKIDFTFYTNGICNPGGATADAGNPFTLSGGVVDPSTVQVPLSVGLYSFDAHYNGDIAYNSADSACMPLTVVKADQTITVSTHAPANAIYNSTFPVAATASSGLIVAMTTTGVCTISGGTVTMTSGTGTCVVHYNQAGNGNYNSAPEVTETTTATKATSSTVVTCPASVTYTGSPRTPCTVSVTGAGGLSLSPAATYSNNINAGTATASYTYAGDSNHTGSSDSKNFTINKATPIITWSNPANIIYGTALSGTQLNASTGVPGIYTYTPPSGTILSVGANQTLFVHFVPTDTANYNTPSDKTVSITVVKATPTISTTIFTALTNLPITHAPSGTLVYDKATLTASFGTPTGTVTFTVSTNKTNCGNPTQSGGTGTLASGVAKSSNYTTSGNTSYQAMYNGDANFNSVPATCEALPAP